MSESKVTTNHDEIRRWVEERGESLARVKGTDEPREGGLLRFDYPGYSGRGKFREDHLGRILCGIRR